jgi:hypothetical protein
MEPTMLIGYALVSSEARIHASTNQRVNEIAFPLRTAAQSYESTIQRINQSTVLMSSQRINTPYAPTVFGISQ